MTCVINDNIEGTTQTIYRTIGKDNSRYLTFHNGGNFNIGCNVVCMRLLAGCDVRYFSYRLWSSWDMKPILTLSVPGMNEPFVW